MFGLFVMRFGGGWMDLCARKFGTIVWSRNVGFAYGEWFAGVDGRSRGFALANEVVGTALGFEVSFAEIFANDAEEEKLNAANKHNQTNEARPASDRVAKDESFADDDDDENKGNETEYNTKESGKGEGNGGESDDAFDGVFEKFPEGPFGFAGDALDIFVFDPFGFETDEAPKPFRITIVFSASEDGANHLTIHEAIIASAINHFDFAHVVNKFIKSASEETADDGFAFAGDAAGSGAIVFFGGGAGRVNVLKKLR